jgi:ribosomal protein L37E
MIDVPALPLTRQRGVADDQAAFAQGRSGIHTPASGQSYAPDVVEKPQRHRKQPFRRYPGRTTYCQQSAVCGFPRSLRLRVTLSQRAKNPLLR